MRVTSTTSSWLPLIVREFVSTISFVFCLTTLCLCARDLMISVFILHSRKLFRMVNLPLLKDFIFIKDEHWFTNSCAVTSLLKALWNELGKCLNRLQIRNSRIFSKFITGSLDGSEHCRIACDKNTSNETQMCSIASDLLPVNNILQLCVCWTGGTRDSNFSNIHSRGFINPLLAWRFLWKHSRSTYKGNGCVSCARKQYNVRFILVACHNDRIWCYKYFFS